MQARVCEICGSSEDQELIARCAQCKITAEHCYCMQVVLTEIPDEWYCSECQEKADAENKPPANQISSSRGQQIEFQKPLDGSDLTKERENSALDPNDRSGVHQICHTTSKKFKGAKVKFISTDDVTLLNEERVPYRAMSVTIHSPCNAIPSASHPIIKQLSSMKSTSLNRTATCDSQMGVLKQCAAASQNPGKCAAASQNPGKLKDIKIKAKGKPAVTFNTNMIEEPTTVAPIVLPTCTGATSKRKSDLCVQIKDEPREKRASNALGFAIGCAETQILHQDREMPVMLVYNPTVENARCPSPTNYWTGCFHIFDGENHNLGGFNARFPSKVSPKAYEMPKKMPKNLQLEVLPRMQEWPKFFKSNPPIYEDIGLFFFSHDLAGHHHFLEAACNFVLRAYIDNVKLLIYSSELLPPDSQWIDGQTYLWGVFVNLKSKPKSNPGRLALVTT